MALKAENIYYLTLCKKSLPTPDLVGEAEWTQISTVQSKTVSATSIQRKDTFSKCKQRQISKCCREKAERDSGLEGRVEMKERALIYMEGTGSQRHWGSKYYARSAGKYKAGRQDWLLRLANTHDERTAGKEGPFSKRNKLSEWKRSTGELSTLEGRNMGQSIWINVKEEASGTLMGMF